jgi:hypothetical protein
MFDPMEVETFWLNATNIALGVVTLICVSVVGFVSFQELRDRVLVRVRGRLTNDDHAFLHDELGLTMADGGERLAVPPPAGEKNSDGNEGNIQRSIN